MTVTIEQELRGRIAALEMQRNRALNDHVLTEGALAFANAEKEAFNEHNKILVKSAAELSARVAELEAKQAAPQPVEPNPGA